MSQNFMNYLGHEVRENIFGITCTCTKTSIPKILCVKNECKEVYSMHTNTLTISK